MQRLWRRIKYSRICPDCGAEFEITSNSEGKVDMKPAESVGEDWGE